MKYKLVFLFMCICLLIYAVNLSKYSIKESFANKYKIKIDKVYIINLDQSKDRLQHMNQQCSNAGINFERVSAIDCRKIDLENLRKIGILGTKKMICGAIGCTLSHIQLWRKIKKENKYMNILILEDDSIIDSNFWKKFNIYSKNNNYNDSTIYNL